MSNAEISSFIDNYVRRNLSPKKEQRDDIGAKYEELSGFLNGNCFQAGSYARHTAIDPVHDLDVIYVLPDDFVINHPQKVMGELKLQLEKSYRDSKRGRVKEIIAQTHSVTIVFEDDISESFSIDVVPAVLANNENNEFNDPIYLVPEILRSNHRRRITRYDNSDKNPIGWIKSDPRGYISIAKDLDERTNGTFRKAVKVVKGWRHKQRAKHADAFMLKSFHLELIAVEYFEANRNATTLSAITGIIALLAKRLDRPHYRDRADSSQYVDQYIEDKLTDQAHQLLMRLQKEAVEVIDKIAVSESVTEVATLLDQLTSTEESHDRSSSSSFAQRVVVDKPNQPWSY